jgi:very-short-patch-repair endonuclease
MFTGVFKERTPPRPTAVAAQEALSRILQSKALRAHRFVRHVEVGPFVVDYACREKGLILEVMANMAGDKQQARIAFLMEMGYRVLHLTPRDLANRGKALHQIQCALCS